MSKGRIIIQVPAPGKYSHHGVNAAEETPNVSIAHGAQTQEDHTDEFTVAGPNANADILQGTATASAGNPANPTNPSSNQLTEEEFMIDDNGMRVALLPNFIYKAVLEHPVFDMYENPHPPGIPVRPPLAQRPRQRWMWSPQFNVSWVTMTFGRVY